MAFLPKDWRARARYALGASLVAAAFCGMFATGSLAWGTYTLWVFVAAVGALAFAMHGYVD
jgi:hypothetical protein